MDGPNLESVRATNSQKGYCPGLDASTMMTSSVRHSRQRTTACSAHSMKRLPLFSGWLHLAGLRTPIRSEKRFAH
jgi:hypothetical protein